MVVRERLTIDVTVARDYQDARRAKHDDAVELFALARSGEVDLATAPQGYRLDVEGDLAEQLRHTFAEEGVAEAPQLAYPSPVTYPGETLFPGAYVPGFSDAWRAVAATWPSHEGKGGPPGDADAFHVETHVLQKRDVFLTDDRSLRVMCDRLREEHGIPIVAMDVREYLDRKTALS